MDELVQYVAMLQAECYADNTNASYSTAVRSFASFCISGRGRGFHRRMLPAEDDVMAAWVVHMVVNKELKPATAKHYLSGLRALHVQLGHEWRPLKERWQVWAALQGARRRWDTPSKQVMPVSFKELLLMSVLVKRGSFNERVVLAAMLVAFFGFFRKDNISVGKQDAWNPRGHLVRSDVAWDEETGGVWLRVRHSKTIQCGERYHWVYLAPVADSPICPVEGLRWVLGQPGLGLDGPLFVVEDAKGKLGPLTHAFFVETFRELATRAGLDPQQYSGHSFRRGGATTAAELQVADRLIQAHGDWASECYKLYCDMKGQQRLVLPSTMAAAAAAASEDFRTLK